jgi:hypothetical protein
MKEKKIRLVHATGKTGVFFYEYDNDGEKYTVIKLRGDETFSSPSNEFQKKEYKNWGGSRENSGGKRENCGRKPFGEVPKTPVTFRFSKPVCDILEAKENKTAFVEDAIIEKEERSDNG